VTPPQNNVVQQPPLTTQPAPIVVQRPVDSPKEAVPPPAPKPATLADISPIVEAYSRAIESKSIDAVRRVYPGVPGSQQRNWETFFQRARNINVTFRIEDFQGSISSAEATLAGTYAYTDSDDKAHRDPVSVVASFQREGNGWRLVSVR
jgi:hypothetical protein